MELQDIKSVAVIGAGDMGHGIVESCALAGFDVYMKDVSKEVLDHAMGRIESSLNILERKKRIEPGSVQRVLERVHPCLDYEEFSGKVQFVIEAVPEIMSLKKSVFQALDESLPDNVVIATNTSNMSITELAAATTRPERVAGMHFFNPVIIMKTVEVIKGEKTNEATMKLAKHFAFKLDKIPIIVKKDLAGFVINRVQAPTQLLLMKIIEMGIASFNQIDAMALNMHQPMGPFETMDFVGLDVVKHGLDYFSEKIGPEYKAPRWLNDLCAAGKLGKKSGEGIFDWSCGRPAINKNDTTSAVSMMDLLIVQINEASRLVDNGVVDDPGDIDVAIMNGTGNKIGIFGLLKTDREKVLERLEELATELGVDSFKPNEGLAMMDVPSARKAFKRLKREKKELGLF
ncbi:MAG: 3-hydroxyacyl-CoA dehydrogenase NAD-binding domain-containing protein [Promethearchaeota archaeon]